MPLAAGLVGIVPALEMLDFDLDGQAPVFLSYWKLVAWCLAVAFFGVFLAAPLRKQVVGSSCYMLIHPCFTQADPVCFSPNQQIVKEKLVFPSGTATAQLISVLHNAPQPTLPASNGSPLSNRYRPLPLNSDDNARISSDAIEQDSGQSLGEEPDIGLGKNEEESMGSLGWRALGLSFAASAGMTVRTLTSLPVSSLRHRSQD